MKISFRKYVVFIFVPLIAVAVLLFNVATNNVDQFFKHEAELATTSLTSTDSLIQQYLSDLRRNVGFFTEHHVAELQQLIDYPDDRVLLNNVREKIDMYFPGAATFTIADSQGNILLEDVDTLIGNGCRENIRLFSISNEQSDAQLRIHSDRLNYHFDIMQEMRTTNGRVAIFFVSFEPKHIAAYLANLELPGHQIMLIKRDAESLIEVTRDGARVNINREKNLAQSELERVLAEKNVDNTLWQLVDIIDASTVSQAKSIVMRDFGIIFASFVLGTLLAFIAILKHEKLRFNAESKLKKLIK